MKTGVVAILLFVAAFIITTAALIYFNTQYRNIFRFDFTPVDHSMLAKVDSTALKQAQNVTSDSTKALDSLKGIANSLAPKADSSGSKNASPAQNTAESVKDPADVTAVKTEIKNAETRKMDATTYEKWKKTTAGILEAMDAKKASQVLRMYSDNIGGDLLYSMKKKKAAEILSKFDAKKDSLIIRNLTRMR